MKANHSSKVHNGMILFSPRSLQLLQHLDLSTQIIEKGTRHWKFNIIQNKGHGGNAVTVDQKSLRLWENEATEFNFSLSCEKSIVCKILEGYLEKQWGITVEYKQEVFDIKEPTDHASEFIPPHTTDLSSYYQYRPLPTPHQSPPTKKENERNTKTVHYRNVETADVQLWKTQSVIGADGPASFVRQKLGMFSFPLFLFFKKGLN